MVLQVIFLSPDSNSYFYSELDEPTADFCKISAVTSLPPGGEISKHLAPDMPKKKSPKGGKTGARRPRKVPPLTNVINPKVGYCFTE